MFYCVFIVFNSSFCFLFFFCFLFIQVVLAMRDLFQVVFELKKKEIELARQHIQSKSIHDHQPVTLNIKSNALESSHVTYSKNNNNENISSNKYPTAKEVKENQFYFIIINRFHFFVLCDSFIRLIVLDVTGVSSRFS